MMSALERTETAPIHCPRRGVPILAQGAAQQALGCAPFLIPFSPQRGRPKREPNQNRRGSVGIVYLLGVTMFVGLLGAGILMASQDRYARGVRMRQNMALEQLADGGVERARAELAHAAN